jgi:hypothetical protein
MNPHTLESVSAWWADWPPSVSIMGDTMPPRDPNNDDDDEDEEDDEDEDRQDEPAVIREPEGN